MFLYRFDSAYGNVIWLFTGTTNSDDDFARYVESFGVLDRTATERGLAMPAGIVVVDAGNPMPNATWRKRIAEASTTLSCRPLIAFVTDSPLARGVVTAINWLRPPPYEFLVTASFDEAVGWVEEKRKVPSKLFFTMLAELRAELH